MYVVPPNIDKKEQRWGNGIPAEDAKTSNLLLFGTAGSNPIIRAHVRPLPKTLLEPQDGSRSIFIYRNPENPDRYIVIWSARVLSLPDHGLRAGYMMPVNLLPDYVRVKEGKIVAGGHFDNQWDGL